MSVASDIETAFLNKAALVSGIAATAAPEPLRIDILPAITMYFIGCPQERSSTGYDVVSWVWQVGITVPLNDIADAQRTLQEVLPGIMQIVRLDPSLDGSCDWANLEDRQEPPLRSQDERSFRKNLYLVCQTTEA